MTSNGTQQKFGFKFGRNGAHAARTMMLAELTELFQGREAEASTAQYQEDIELFNVLHKPTEKARKLTWRHLVDLYAMDKNVVLFRAFRRLWESDASARALLTCQIALARDPLLRLSQEKVLSLVLGQLLLREEMEQAFEEQFPDRYSPATLKSLAQNVNGTWTDAGYLQGRSKKRRTEPDIRPVNVAFALFMGYLQGATGNRLFNTEWTKLLGCRQERLLELARQASHSGLLNFKHSSEVVEVTFPDYLTKEEEGWLHE
ncbi:MULTISPECIES: hypothetical protein [Pseudomonas]|uniref:hypothetical protein n=1 Tax=Pseudomonas TaxID=286 RepID=UPI0018AAEED5|nr:MULTISPECIES: hypothetical protein [Pseudomonas]MBF8789098.1 hypothetical protein [Pseudomonas asiatica]MDD2027162.1 hypothetical protein [Pseudomonas putida]WPX87879.1 hypothetical protein PsasTeo6_16776 [Pseudomonas asiatica]HDS1766719.1 hypothetical protein [Pseudomonas putida]